MNKITRQTLSAAVTMALLASALPATALATTQATDNAAAATVNTIATNDSAELAADSVCPAAQKAADEALAAYNVAAEKLATATTAQAAAEQAYNDAKAYANKGALGFFQWAGYDSAAAILINAGSVDALQTAGNANTLENFKQAGKWVAECNEIRATLKTDPTNGNTLEALKINTDLLAMSIVQTNTSAKSLNHSQLYNVAENLAWGQADPFSYSNGWMNEKAIYEQGIASNPSLKGLSGWELYSKYPSFYTTVGHYLNIADASYHYTGFTVNSESGANPYGTTFGQVFKGSASQGSTSMTPEEFNAKIAEFENSVSTAQANIDAANSALATAKSEELAAKVAYSEAAARAKTGEHTWGAWTNLKEPTTTEQGEATRTCTACGETESKTVDCIQTSAVYRLYNPATSEHLWTTDENERDVLASEAGWNYEDVGWQTLSADSFEAVGVYRLYNPVLGVHHYTSDLNEIAVLTGTQGWVADNKGNPLFYEYSKDNNWGSPVYRLYNDGLSQHHLTMNEGEVTTLVDQFGWKSEAIAFRVPTA